MNKELEACFKEIYHEIEYVYDSKVCSKANKNWSNDIKHYDNIRGNVLTIQRYLEAIDNTNPSEALECLDKLAKQIELDEDTDYWEIRNAHKTVEQALLKAQEPKKYLKWEDLEFTNEVKEMKVKLGDNTYEIEYYICNALGLPQPVVILKTSDFIAITIEQFFNDLHLERVEE